MVNKKSKGLRFKDSGVYDWSYRQAFLSYLEAEAPEVLQALVSLAPKWNALINHYPYSGSLTDYLIEPQTTEFSQGFREWILRFHVDVEHRYNIQDQSLLAIEENAAWERFIEFRKSYSHVLELNGLTLDWLRQGLLKVIEHMVRFPKDRPSLCHAYTHAWFPAEGAGITLKIDRWKIEESWKDFEARARAEFERQLAACKAQSISFFQAQGYKRNTKPLDLTPVKWLVWWTVKRMSKADILAKIDADRGNIDKLYDVKTLEHHFRQLKKFDLPVRKG